MVAGQPCPARPRAARAVCLITSPPNRTRACLQSGGVGWVTVRCRFWLGGASHCVLVFPEAARRAVVRQPRFVSQVLLVLATQDSGRRQFGGEMPVLGARLLAGALGWGRSDSLRSRVGTWCNSRKTAGVRPSLLVKSLFVWVGQQAARAETAVPGKPSSVDRPAVEMAVSVRTSRARD